MVKTFTKVLHATLIFAACSISANAQDYISVNPTITPEDGYMGGPRGNITVSWPGVSLQMDSQDKDVKTPVDPSYVKITLNGNPVIIDPDAIGGGKIYVGAQETEGGGRMDDILAILLPDMFFWWDGNVQIDILEGAVTSTSGAINKAISLNYTFTNLNYDAIWYPARSDDGSDVILIKGDAFLYVSWEGCSDLTITPDANPFYQKATEDDNGTQISARQYMSIDNGSVKFDLTTLDTGTYILDLTEGSIDLGDGSQNGETIYNFKIVETQVPQYYVSPMPSSYDWFDSFNVIWADNITQPYELSSEYASLNSDSGKLEFNEEGISLFKVSLNNVEDIEIQAIAIEEYQEDEYSDNYPNAQLLITLADLQTVIDGRYSLTIPAGIINISTPDGIVVNDQITYTFNLKAKETFVLPAPTVNPAEGNVEDLKEIIISWPAVLGGFDLLNKNQDSSSEITVTFNGEAFTDFETSFVWSSEDAKTEGSDGDQLIITLGDDLEYGTYVIVIPEGYINVSDIEKGTYSSQLINLIYTLGQEEVVLPAPIVDPAEGIVEDLEEIIISWPAVSGESYFLNKNQESSNEITVTFNGAAFTGFKTSFAWSSIEAETEGFEGDQFVITLGDNLELGTYIINIPEGYINVLDIEYGTYPSQLINLIYTLEIESGVNSISRDDNVTIYNLNGVKVADNMGKSIADNLPKGIYIVNGKKVVVK